MREFRLCALASILLIAVSCQKPAAVKAKQDTGPIPVRVAPVMTRQIQRVVAASRSACAPIF